MAHDIAALNKQLNDLILTGDILAAFEQFYGEDAVMQENEDAPTVGKAANREREKGFKGMLEAFSGEVLASASEDNVSFSEFRLDMTLKGMGRIVRTQVSRRVWRDGKVVNERFYYKG
jgi:hypothetical protein